MNRAEYKQEIIENLVRCQRPSSFPSWKEVGLSHAQVSMLYMLSYHKKITAKQIAEYLGISKSAISQLIDPLVENGFVTRSVDPKDRRIARLSLNLKGKEILNKLSKSKFAGLRSALDSLEPKEIEQLHKLSLKMANQAPSSK